MKIFPLMLIFFTVFSVHAESLKIVCDDNYPPFSFISNGELVGIIPDQWKLFSKQTGVDIEITGMKWSEAVSEFESGKFDVIDTIFETENRDKFYYFSQAYAKINIPIFIHKSISGISNINDLKYFKVAVKEGDASSEKLKKAGIKTISYSNYESIIEDAAKGNIKLFCIDEPPAIYYLEKYNISNNWKIAFTLDKLQFHRAVKKNNYKILILIENGFNLISQSEYDKINRKWTGTSIYQDKNIKSAFFLLLIISVLAAFIIFLKKQINKKQDELNQINKELEQRIFNKTNELRNTYDKLLQSEKLASLGSLVSSIAHEINTPLAAIITSRQNIEYLCQDKIVKYCINLPKESFDLIERLYNENIKNEYYKNINLYDKNKIVKQMETQLYGRNYNEDDIVILYDCGYTEINDDLIKLLESQCRDLIKNFSSLIMIKQNTEIINQAAHKIEKIVSALKIYSHIDLKEEKEFVDIKEQINSILVLYNNQMKYNITINKIFEDCKTVYGYKKQLNQIWINIINNSLQAMSYKGTLTVHLFMIDENHLCVEISDTGIGIDDNIKEKIFTPFFTTKNFGEGSGLGLSICKKIIDSHNGSINFISKKSLTTFKVILPTSEEKNE